MIIKTWTGERQKDAPDKFIHTPILLPPYRPHVSDITNESRNTESLFSSYVLLLLQNIACTYLTSSNALSIQSMCSLYCHKQLFWTVLKATCMDCYMPPEILVSQFFYLFFFLWEEGNICIQHVEWDNPKMRVKREMKMWKWGGGGGLGQKKDGRRNTPTPHPATTTTFTCQI